MALSKKKAAKEKLHIKVLLSGPAGSGKSYSALRLATGIVSREPGEIVVLNTEKERGELYGRDFDYYIEDLEDFSPEGYLRKIKEIIDGYPDLKVLIIDSISHGWTWICDTVVKMPGDNQLNWGKMKNRNRILTDFIQGAPVHIIATGRGKDEYTREINDAGKTVIKKVGVGTQADKDAEYEYMVTFNIDQATNVASCMKDNTHLFEGRYEKLTEEDGVKLYDWAASGEIPFDYKKAQEEIIDLATKLGGSSDEKVKEATIGILGEANPRNCKNQHLLEESLNALKKLMKEREE